MNRPDRSKSSVNASLRRTRPSFRTPFRLRLREASACACACTLLTVGACSIDERAPALAPAGETPGPEGDSGGSGNGAPTAPGAGPTGGDTQGAGTEGEPALAGIDPGNGTSGAAPVVSPPAASKPADDAMDPALPAPVEPIPADSVPAPIVRPEGPCDIYAAASVPCVGAYSVVRALSSGYTGPLYQVRRGAPNPSQNTGAGGETLDIGVLASGFADAAAQQMFCGSQPCTVSTLYDQSGQANHLSVAPAGCFTGAASEAGFESSAMDAQLTVGGNTVYGLYMRPQEGYRNNDAVNTPEGEDEKGTYSVVAGSGTRPEVLPGCCWNFGISTRDNCFGPVGATNALFFGVGFWGRGAGNGPWFLADFEGGLWAGGTAGSLDTGEAWDVNPNNPSMTMNYAFGILKSRPNNYALRMGDAQQGNLTTAYDGPTPMPSWQMGGSIILGIASDNSNQSQGTFFEGAITAGRPSDAIDEAILRNVQGAGYGR